MSILRSRLIVIPLAFLGILAVVVGIWVLAMVGMDRASANQVVQRACDGMEQIKSYDVTATVSEAQGETITLTAMVEGDDYHITLTAQSDGATAEYMQVGGASYVRESRFGPDWRLSEVPFGGFNTDSLGLGDNPICPEVRGFSEVGQEQIGGVDTRRYTDVSWVGASEEPNTGPFKVDDSFRGVLTSADNDFWIDGDGRIVQHKQKAYQLMHLGDGPRQQTTIVTTSTFSGFGEPNVIATPAPTLTPT